MSASRALHPPTKKCRQSGWHECGAYKVLDRKTRLPKASKPLPRTTRVKARNAKRKGHRFPKVRSPAFIAWLGTQKCVVTGQPTGGYVYTFSDGTWGNASWRPDKSGWGDERPNGMRSIFVVAAHVKSRGAGGADRQNAVSLASFLHEEQHRIGIKSFQKKYNVDLAAKALEQDAAFEAEADYVDILCPVTR